MNNKLTPEQIKEALVALDEVLSSGPWKSSNFLGLIGTKLKKIRDDFVQSVEQADVDKANVLLKNQVISDEKRSKLQRVYVAVYATDGSNLQSWERIILNLPKQIISRPIYANEDDVLEAVRSKSNPINEAYVAIFIDPTTILAQESEKVATDKLGKPLLALKDKAIDLEHIDMFVHKTGNYHFRDGHLIKCT